MFNPFELTEISIIEGYTTPELVHKFYNSSLPDGVPVSDAIIEENNYPKLGDALEDNSLHDLSGWSSLNTTTNESKHMSLVPFAG